MTIRRFVYRTRGLYLAAALAVILWLKHRTGAEVSLPRFLTLLAFVVAAQVFRTWAAGFIGTTARQRDIQANTLVTAGPYAFVRNPMYLGILIIVTTAAAMSGLWYALPIAWAVYAIVYANVIPFEEDFLRGRFGDEYLSYCGVVPRLIPTLRGYPTHRGVFRLREGLTNETAAWIVAAAFSLGSYLL